QVRIATQWLPNDSCERACNRRTPTTASARSLFRHRARRFFAQLRPFADKLHSRSRGQSALKTALRQLRTFKTHVRIFGSEIAIFSGLAPAGSKPRVFPTLNLVLRTER